MAAKPVVRFSVIGLNHPHIYAQTKTMLDAGARLVSFYAPEIDLVTEFSAKYPQATLARSMDEVLEDPTVQLIVTAAIPADRAAIGLAAMRHGKDVMSDKPGFTTLRQLQETRQVQAETGRIYSILYGERLENRATLKAGDLVRQGAIGQVIQTIGLGPHRIRLSTRAEWFFRRARYGGILCDIGSHQMDQFLHFTGSTSAEIVAAQVGNTHYPQYPELEDFGDVMLQGDGGAGYVRVDWFTPDGIEPFGDGRLVVLGSDGTIEVRKYCDIAGRPRGDHLILVDHKGAHYMDCADVPLTYGRNLVSDIVNRTETAMPQAHCFLASELALQAQAKARRFGHLRL